jgi:exoribonuclease R
MANFEVAQKLVKDFGAHSLIIYHPKPSNYNIEHLNDYVSDFGVKFKADSMYLLEE